jgi:hypothetical protein
MVRGGLWPVLWGRAFGVQMRWTGVQGGLHGSEIRTRSGDDCWEASSSHCSRRHLRHRCASCTNLRHKNMYENKSDGRKLLDDWASAGRTTRLDVEARLHRQKATRSPLGQNLRGMSSTSSLHQMKRARKIRISLRRTRAARPGRSARQGNSYHCTESVL